MPGGQSLGEVLDIPPQGSEQEGALAGDPVVQGDVFPCLQDVQGILFGIEHTFRVDLETILRSGSVEQDRTLNPSWGVSDPDEFVRSIEDRVGGSDTVDACSR